MVLDPPKKPVDVVLMVVLSFIPFVSIWVMWRIQKFWLILGLSLGLGIALSIGLMPLALVMPELVWILSISMNIGVGVILVYYFAEKWNEKVSGITKSSGNNERITDYVEHDTDIQNKSQTSKDSGMVPVDKWNEKYSED